MGLLIAYLAQAHSVGLSHSVPPRRGGKTITMVWVPIHSSEETCVRVCAQGLKEVHLLPSEASLAEWE